MLEVLASIDDNGRAEPSLGRVGEGERERDRVRRLYGGIRGRGDRCGGRRCVLSNALSRERVDTEGGVILIFTSLSVAALEVLGLRRTALGSSPTGASRTGCWMGWVGWMDCQCRLNRMLSDDEKESDEQDACWSVRVDSSALRPSCTACAA